MFCCFIINHSQNIALIQTGIIVYEPYSYRVTGYMLYLSMFSIYKNNCSSNIVYFILFIFYYESRNLIATSLWIVFINLKINICFYQYYG